MDKERYTIIAKWVSIVTLSVIIVATLIALIYPLLQIQTVTYETADIARANSDKLAVKIDYNKSGFSYVGDIPLKEEEPSKSTVEVNMATGLYSGYSLLSQQCNLELYSLCEQYFTVEDLSPLYVMCIANNESAIRADKNITFSSLYPSKIVPISSVEDIRNFSSLAVLKDSYTFEHLAADWWTRDRGPVQMMSSYGIHNDYFYTLMGDSEQSLLKSIDKTHNYSAYTTKEGIINSSYWIEQASFEKGDRHNIKDVCLRMASEATYALNLMRQTYSVSNSRLAMIMLSMHHGAGSLWSPTYKNSEIGYWKSGNIAYGYARSLAREDVYSIIYNKAKTDILNARVNSTNPDIGISTAQAEILYNQLKDNGYISDINTYTVAGEYRLDYIVYPIKMLYNFAQLQILYNGG